MKILFFIILIIFNLHSSVDIISTKACNFNSLSTSQIKHLFLLNIKQINNQPIIVYNRKNDKLMNSFNISYLHKESRQLRAYWTRMIFTGQKQAPLKISNLYTLKNDRCMITYKNNYIKISKKWKELKIYE